MTMTKTIFLPVGVTYDGAVHKDVAIRERKVRDLMEAGKETRGDEGLFTVALYARQIVRLGSIPSEAITTDFLLDMRPADWNALATGIEEAEKDAASFRVDAE